MAKRKKTWAETHELVPNESWRLLDYLQLAVHRTCRRMGWDWSIERETETFCKCCAWLPHHDREGAWVRTDVFLDAEAKNPLTKIHTHSGRSQEAEILAALGDSDYFYKIKVEGEVFTKALKSECVRLVKEWKQAQMGRGDLTTPEINYRREKVRRANQIKEQDPPKTWKEIAKDKEIDLPERTLRDWRHNPLYK
jgi:hypothetical protein